MDEFEFNKLIKKDRYQVFIFSCPISFPLNFITHTWVVISNKGKITRYEVQKYKSSKNSYIHKNLKKPWEGYRIFFTGKKPIFKSKIIHTFEGKEESVANRIVNFIEKNVNKYPEISNYKYIPGPNSNSFIQWILDNFSRTHIKLPKSAIGKNYHIK